MRFVENSKLQPRQICGILSNGRLPWLPRRSVCEQVSKAYVIAVIEVALYQLLIAVFGSLSIYPVHPGNAKQVMEPAILWFERRARRVQACDKRQTLNFSNGLEIMGGDYPSFQ